MARKTSAEEFDELDDDEGAEHSDVPSISDMDLSALPDLPGVEDLER